MKVLVLDDMEIRHHVFRRRFIGHELTEARTAAEAIAALDATVFDQVQLDHDLSEEHYLTMSEGVSEDRLPGAPVYAPGTGMDVVDHIVAMPPERRPKLAIVHSMNSARSPEMVARLKDGGVPARWAMFNGRA